MKRLRFSEPLPELILSGRKTVTWRINDEKNIQQGDVLSLSAMFLAKSLRRRV